MYLASDRLDYVMQPFVVAHDLVRAVGENPVADSEQVFVACARIISTESWLLHEAIQIGAQCKFTEVLDPESAWWLPLRDESGMGVHFCRLVNRLSNCAASAPLRSPRSFTSAGSLRGKSGANGRPGGASPMLFE